MSEQKLSERSEPQLDRLRELAEQATPGPWDAGQTGPFKSTIYRGAGYVGLVAADVEHADAAYIAAANPSVILALLSERHADRERIAELEEGLENLANAYVRDWGRSADDEWEYQQARSLLFSSGGDKE